MIKKIITSLLALLPMMIAAQDIIYSKSDSIAIEKILSKHQAGEYSNKGELSLAIAHEFIGKKYVANTLENGAEEPLFISCDRLDCSTFVELVTAISLTVIQNKKNFDDVERKYAHKAEIKHIINEREDSAAHCKNCINRHGENICIKRNHHESIDYSCKK